MTDRRDPRRIICRFIKIVKTGHAEIFRNLISMCRCRLTYANRNIVIRTDDRLRQCIMDAEAPEEG